MISYRQYTPAFFLIVFAIWSGFAHDDGYHGASFATGILAFLCVVILMFEWEES